MTLTKINLNPRYLESSFLACHLISTQLDDFCNKRNGRQPNRKTTKKEDDQNGRRPKWKTTKMEDDQNRKGPK